MRILPLFAVVFLVAELRAQAPASLEQAARSISADDIRRRINIVADDSMLGRDTPSRGLETTARYVEAEFRRLGLAPGGEGGSYVQRWAVRRQMIDSTAPVDAVIGTAPNLIGILEGADPKLAGQYVVYSAHMDHVGVFSGRPDSIYNGADDNASGLAGLLELAEAFSRSGAQPRRSIIFFAPSGEEKGLWGSAHFTEQPTVPIDSIVANLNMDLIGRNWRDSVIVSGLELSDLAVTLRRVVAKHRELDMTPIADRWPEEYIFYRSDHYHFARVGVPVLFFTSGTHADYHRTSDSPSTIDVEKAARLVRLLFYLGHEVAQQSERPRWDPAAYRGIFGRLPPSRN